jgi:hypothetical protein
LKFQIINILKNDIYKKLQQNKIYYNNKKNNK